MMPTPVLSHALLVKILNGTKMQCGFRIVILQQTHSIDSILVVQKVKHALHILNVDRLPSRYLLRPIVLTKQQIQQWQYPILLRT
jgi:hypothetical protein